MVMFTHLFEFEYIPFEKFEIISLLKFFYIDSNLLLPLIFFADLKEEKKRHASA